MVRSIMEYCGFVTDGGPVWAARQMQTLQNDALRICERIRDPRGVNVDALHTRNNLSELKPARSRELLCHLHKMSMNPRNLVVPARDLRGNSRLQLRVARSKSGVYDRSPIHRGVLGWNELPASTQKLSHAAFVKVLKTWTEHRDWAFREPIPFNKYCGLTRNLNLLILYTRLISER